MASQAVDVQQAQAQLLQSFDQVQSLSVEIAAMNTEIDLFNTDHIAKYQQIANLMSANRQLSDGVRRTAASSSMGRGRDDVSSST